MLSFDSAVRLINSSGQRCDIYGRITKARGAKGRNSSNRRGWDGWQGSEGSHWRDACTELRKLTSLSTNTHSGGVSRCSMTRAQHLSIAKVRILIIRSVAILDQIAVRSLVATGAWESLRNYHKRYARHKD